jgi:hypothetical protein
MGRRLTACKAVRVSAVILGAVVATACSDKGDRFDPIVVDIAANCAEAEIDVLLAEMEEGNRPWDRVLAVAVDAPGIDAYWALVEEDGMLALTHVDGERWTPLRYLEPDAVEPSATMDLRPGPVPGTAWLVHKGPGTFRLWQMQVTLPSLEPSITPSPEHGEFPQSVAGLCEDELCDVTDWERELVFLDGAPFLASVPPFSPNNTTWVYVGRLDAFLYNIETKPLEFERSCDPADPLPEYTACTEENAETTYPEITVMGSQQTASAQEHRMFLLRQRAIADVPEPAREVVFLKLFLSSQNAVEGTIQSKALEEVEPIAGPPSGIVRDAFASYMLHPTLSTTASGGVGPPVITRLAEAEDEFDILQGILLPDEISLLQLESDIALGRVVDGTWEVTQLFPAAPERSQVTTYTASAEIVAATPAGHGAFLLFKNSRGPDLVHLACTEDDP